MEKANLSYIDELSGGAISFKQKLITIIKEELPQETELYYNLLKENNLPKVAPIVHKLKHKISILGMSDSYQIAIDYEEALKKGVFKDKEKFEAILDEMNHFIESL